MFTTNLAEYKIKQNELISQADNYRLVKSLEKNNPMVSRIANAIGRNLVYSGQQLISRTQMSR